MVKIIEILYSVIDQRFKIQLLCYVGHKKKYDKTMFNEIEIHNTNRIRSTFEEFESNDKNFQSLTKY